jgi:hypothetical protein
MSRTWHQWRMGKLHLAALLVMEAHHHHMEYGGSRLCAVGGLLLLPLRLPVHLLSHLHHQGGCWVIVGGTGIKIFIICKMTVNIM